ncbi:hypothetical protein [Natronosalvus halobius]|uniref:hypothetical protein n=1 Tax=Natronosalvus halobius TaxID=2953746 RepID=UPI00209E6B39|nr:hypothetical protein [Natronosalvus halobius]USZ71827.1 hypothetical protein NGM15_00525 [Natronosalvus halobius]
MNVLALDAAVRAVNRLELARQAYSSDVMDTLPLLHIHIHIHILPHPHPSSSD